MQEKRIYLIAAFLSFLFYTIGIMSGLFIEKSMTDYTKSEVKSLQRRIENLQLEYAFLSIIGEDLSCDSLSPLVSETTTKVRDLGKELEAEKEGFVVDREFTVESANLCWMRLTF